MEIERSDLLNLIDRHEWWYHAMDLGQGVITPGQYGSNLLPVASLMDNMNLKGMDCLDIGTMDGKMAFLMENMGGNVVTADVFERGTVSDLIQLFSSSVKYIPGIRDSNLTDLRSSVGHFDFVLCAGVLYHIFSPIDMIANVRQVIKNDGYAIFESACINNERKSFMQLNWGDLYSEHTTIWVPSIACLQKMLQYFGFEIIGDAILTDKIPRYAVLCKACKPSLLGSTSSDPWLCALLQKATPGISSGYLLPQLDIDTFESAPVSEIKPVSLPVKRRSLSSRRPRQHAVETKILERATPGLRH